jgi:hypothetical protein
MRQSRRRHNDVCPCGNQQHEPRCKLQRPKDRHYFRVYSSQATYMKLYLYSTGCGAQESATYVLSPTGSNVWAVTVAVSAIQSAGITGTVYYGYRAWGPNWTYARVGRKGPR